MFHLTFYPESNMGTLPAAAHEYQMDWNLSGLEIVEAVERVSGLRFRETMVNAIVYEGPSHSHPLMLRASYSADVRRGALVHELCHRLVAVHDIGLPTTGENKGLAHHKRIDLILYDTWVRLYGPGFARRMTEYERQLNPVYGQAWDWALAMTPEERAQKFASLRRLAAGAPEKLP